MPHFEKMLYDNAQLLRVYVHWVRLGGTPEYPAAEAAGLPGDRRWLLSRWVPGGPAPEAAPAQGTAPNPAPGPTKGDTAEWWPWRLRWTPTRSSTACTPRGQPTSGPRPELRNCWGRTTGRPWRGLMNVRTPGQRHGRRLPAAPGARRLPAATPNCGTGCVRCWPGAPAHARSPAGMTRWWPAGTGWPSRRWPKPGPCWGGRTLWTPPNGSRRTSTVHWQLPGDGAGRLVRVSHGGAARGIGGLLEDYAFCAEGLFALYAATGHDPLVPRWPRPCWRRPASGSPPTAA